MELLQVIGAMVISFTVVLLIVPSILRVAQLKHLFEPFEERKIHNKLIPPLGGVAIFIGFILSISIASYGLDFGMIKYLIVSVVLMFFVGLKDDLITIDAKKKLLVQFLAATILIVLADVRFTNLHGILGMYEIGYITSFLLSLFAIVVITNAINLIDGIDGLASGIIIFASSILGSWFFFVGHYQLSIISFSLAGSLVAFFLYNVFGTTNKLFMGDSGSLVIGIVISSLVIQFNELNLAQPTTLKIQASPLVSFAILVVPLVDTLRVMSIRISQKKSPFSADNNHIHHRLIKLYNNHLKATLTLIFVSLLFVIFSLLLNKSFLNINAQFLILFLAGIGMSSVPSFFIKRNKSTIEHNSKESKNKVIRLRPDFESAIPDYNVKKKRNRNARDRHYNVGRKEQNNTIHYGLKANFGNRLFVIGDKTETP